MDINIELSNNVIITKKKLYIPKYIKLHKKKIYRRETI